MPDVNSFLTPRRVARPESKPRPPRKRPSRLKRLTDVLRRNQFKYDQWLATLRQTITGNGRVFK